MKFDVMPAIKLSTGLPPNAMSLMNMPTAAPSPPTQGPKIAAKTAGIITCGQNLTPPKLRGIIVDTRIPKATYNAAFNAKATMCNVFNVDHCGQVTQWKPMLQLSIPYIKFKHV
jgi:hypothetical protein